jgi:hypothetical protein
MEITLLQASGIKRSKFKVSVVWHIDQSGYKQVMLMFDTVYPDRPENTAAGRPQLF